MFLTVMRLSLNEEDMTNSDLVASALKATKKGQLKYDTKWMEEGRTEEIVNTVEEGLCSIRQRPNGPFTGNLVTQDRSPLNGSSTPLFGVSIDTHGHSLSSPSKQQYHRSPHSPPETILNSTALPSPDGNNRRLPAECPAPIFSSSPSKDETEQIKKYEQERSERVQKKVEETASRLRAKYDSLLETMDSELRLIQNNYIVLSIQKQKQYEEELNNLMKGLDNGLPFPEPTPQNPVNKDANSKLKEFQEKQKLLEKQKQLRLQQQLEYRQTVSICRDRINQVITQCRLQQEAKESLLIPTAIDELHQYTTLLRKLASDLELLLVQRSEFTADDVQSAIQKHQESERIKLRFGGLLAQFQPPAPVPSVAPSTIGPPNQSTIGPSPIHQSASSSNIQPSAVTTPAKAGVSTTSSSNGPDEFTISAKNLYFQTQLELVKVEEVCNKFSDDKSKRPQVQLAIRTPINTMCNEHISKLYEKTRKLLEILQGHRFEASKGYVQVNSQDGSMHFAINCAVKAFLSVNVKQKNMAIKLAPVIAVLWSRVPLFGKIFLAHLYRNCPYAIPYFPEQEKDQTEEEYMVTCGYQPNSQGAITESDENFQDRVYATIHLYSAVIQCNLREGHPRDLHYAWNWLSRVLNEPPKPRLTALILDAFLSVSAHKLLQCYGRQFQKMIAFITRTYLQKIEAITETTERQTLMKFKSLLSNIERKMRQSRLQDAVRQLASELNLVPDSFFN